MKRRSGLLKTHGQKSFLVGIIKAAAIFVREFIQDRQEDGIINKDQLLSSISRVVWNQDANIAAEIIESSSFAAKHLKVSLSDDGISSSVSLVDAVAFSDLCNKTKTLVISHLSKENELRKPSPSKSNASSKLARASKVVHFI